ncbi:YceI family protein [Daejeonella sp.]|uniref:YceI family protein n=1 Tax=Daejeonella sp. TaxID=2805397 RepID=UPI0025BC1906|nr:YceI family protein [Daejeonella sp.]
MKKTILIALMAVLGQASVYAQSAWNIDKAHSKIGFTIVHLGISDVDGLFKNFDATIKSSKPDFSDGIFEFSADVNSINTEIEMRDEHLRGADFFDAAKYPKLTFKSTSIKALGKNKYALKGNLTMRGVTKPATFNLTYRGTVVHPQSKANVAGFQLSGKILRKDFNLGAGYPAPMLSDEVEIKANGEFTAK